MVDVVLLNRSHLEGVRKLVGNTNFKPYRYLLREIPAEKVNNCFYNRISEALVSESKTPYAAWIEEEVVGLGILEELAWDSSVFGIRMAKIDHLISDDSRTETETIKDRLIATLCAKCADMGVEHLSCKVNTDDIASTHALEGNRFRLMDTLLDYAFDCRKDQIEDVESPCVIRPIWEGEDKDVAEVARAAFTHHFGRFHADKRLARKGATELYARWARNACRGYADLVLVAQLDGRIVGYSVWKKPGLDADLLGVRVGSYGICGIHPDAHGMGTFKALTLAGMRWLNGEADIIEGPTHVNNYPVQRGYAALRWQIFDARHTFHRWIERRAS